MFNDRYTFRIFRLAGIEVRLHISVAIIFALVVFGLANGALAQWHNDWGVITVWSTAILSGILFLASLLAHELSHSLVALREGMRVPSITLSR